MIAALAPNEARAVALVFRAVVGERDLHRGVDSFAARIGEENVVEVAGGENASREDSSNTCGWANWKAGA